MTEELRHRFSGSFAATAAGDLTGTVVVYGDRARYQAREVIAPGAFDPLPIEVPLYGMHDREDILAAATLADSPERLELRARVRPDSMAGRLVKRGGLRGLSLDYYADETRMDNGIEVVTKGRIVGVSLVDEPAFARSTVRMRYAPDGGAVALPWWHWA